MTDPQPDPQYVDRDHCDLPRLVSGDQVLPQGYTYACPHYLWTVQWIVIWGWLGPQPCWTAGPLPTTTTATVTDTTTTAGA